jgi:hypothetical protein
MTTAVWWPLRRGRLGQIAPKEYKDFIAFIDYCQCGRIKKSYKFMGFTKWLEGSDSSSKENLANGYRPGQEVWIERQGFVLVKGRVEDVRTDGIIVVRSAHAAIGSEASRGITVTK